jgi:uncharacterized protein (TIGR03086 family)
MTQAAADSAAGADMLAQAVSYALGTVTAVTPDLLARPTPCRGWNLRMLLRHSCESLAALREGLAEGRVSLAAADDSASAADPVAQYTVLARGLLDCRASPAWPVVRIGHERLPHCVVAAAGALEVAVHGWDVAEACGELRPVPALLAVDLLAVAPLLVPSAGREPLFGAPVSVSRDATASERLTAFLGRSGSGQPDWRSVHN